MTEAVEVGDCSSEQRIRPRDKANCMFMSLTTMSVIADRYPEFRKHCPKQCPLHSLEAVDCHHHAAVIFYLMKIRIRSKKIKFS